MQPRSGGGNSGGNSGVGGDDGTGQQVAAVEEARVAAPLFDCGLRPCAASVGHVNDQAEPAVSAAHGEHATRRLRPAAPGLAAPCHRRSGAGGERRQFDAGTRSDAWLKNLRRRQY
eukprot:2604567-Pleurochrysis_carterae.AAC.1